MLNKPTPTSTIVVVRNTITKHMLDITIHDFGIRDRLKEEAPNFGQLNAEPPDWHRWRLFVYDGFAVEQVQAYLESWGTPAFRFEIGQIINCAGLLQTVADRKTDNEGNHYYMTAEGDMNDPHWVAEEDFDDEL